MLPLHPECGRGLYQCLDGSCILQQHVCDGHEDCPLKEDENNCNCIGFGCHGMFTCKVSYCLPLRYLCDGMYDCPEGQDEHPDLCSSSYCTGLFRCQGEGTCIHPSDIGDGITDC
ncbi:hypothetical protein CAPTEDRAFT_118063, partial [Capitella teleta]